MSDGLPNEGLSCLCHMPLTWQAALLEPEDRQRQMREATLLLIALNQIESTHELETSGPENRRLDRIEAKLDLTLHLLARTLENGDMTNTCPTALSVQLTPSGAQWQDAAPPTEGTRLILEIRPSEALPLSLKLPAIAVEAPSGNARVSFEYLSEGLAEALYQFVFRRHRQAIRARTA